MSVMQVAMRTGMPYMEMRDLVFADPTMAERLNDLFATLE